MQRPGFNQGFPGGMNNGMPMQPGAPGGPARFNNPGGPVYAPGYGQPMPGQQHPQNFQPNAGCFMPAAAIRKISNTMPPQQFNPSFQ
ncbi:uncharacterized shell protein 22-like [Trichoplusia ni]|uniref:Uncharacterized shell protein 22-like n=1 Tax=Trichoplusia ni TaxID=7111 RepID=A0A7E5VU54_TRINI|nr:uncharacterized shell protein 22-like [Trichoplusia ni]